MMDKLNHVMHSYGYNIIGFFSSSAAVYEHRTGHILLQVNSTSFFSDGIEDLQRALIFGLVGFVIPAIGKRVLKKIGW